MTVNTKANGYEATGLQKMIAVFDRAAQKLFPDCDVEHFYYGDTIDMVDVRLAPGKYAHFNLTSKRGSLNGYTCSREALEKFKSMTYRDELYTSKSRLFAIAG